MTRLAIASTYRLSSGHGIPIVGLGVYKNSSCIPACEAALKHGYRHIDTAQMYKNEADVGTALRQSGLKREEVFVTTKIVQAHQDSQGAEATFRIVEDSLSKLGFDYIDLYLIHSPLAGKEKRLETYAALLKKRDEGKIKTVGVSNYGVKHLEEIKEAGLETPAVNQIELHPFCQQRPIVEYCRQHNIIVEVYCPLIRGDFSSPVLQEVASKNNKNPAQVLVRWSLQKGFIPLPKSSNPERVISNVDVFDFELSNEDMSRLDALDKGDAGAISWNPVNAQ